MKLQLKDKRVLVLGLGETGLSALRWLKRQGARLSVADTRETPPGLATLKAELPDATIHLGPFRREVFEAADVIVASPGVPLAEPEIQAALKHGTPVVGDVELFAQYKLPQSKVIAITGANGKSTVTTLVGAMCEQAGLKTVVAGNIGLPVLDVLEPPADVYVLELSSFQLETTSSLHADAATVLNVTEDHMDRYDGMEDYAAAKARVFFGNGVQVLNREDEWSRSMALPGRSVVSFGTDAPQGEGFGLIAHENTLWLGQGEQRLLDTAEMRITGLHNAANALAALALCRAIGLDMAPLLTALREFKGLPHRVEWVAEVDGVAYYDDSKGTNVGATCAAIAGLPRKVVLIAGGDGKGQDFAPLREPVAQNARAVVLIGRDGPQIGKAVSEAGVPLLQAKTLEDAVQLASQVAQQGDAVLLSPACASFDMFRNYAHRAEVFVQAVRQLQKEAA
ncbi:UDP-N-acetylmuramoylalanine--D-glutamate ligase [Novimethylophilus kurashikiensis]|uniref:UDP-N-acetylmuramoylalanine--D-glutamate ligase n=1 Tax=Novimethylophilus kurashikiensis TaxID=1825523 RepID=A0A2R5FFE5_9PROT|nr:UDP-N-acetylmuramoyl-L-alanine--D-glutamate ligase [Novimethylophilus kurashikiensis]GBG15363.1 UDP-N-acetylmuramoylalanine--D-glutamate ligase [Novimethylophilus kurashikiensis]